MAYEDEDWSTITSGSEKADLWEALQAIPGLGRGCLGMDMKAGLPGALSEEVLEFPVDARALGQRSRQAGLNSVVEMWHLRGSNGDGLCGAEPGDVCFSFWKLTDMRKTKIRS